MNLEDITETVKERLSEKRFIHSYSVMERCEELAKIYGVDIEKAKLVGMAHDIAKEMPDRERFMYIAKNNIQTDEMERANTALLHGKIGADICKKEFGFTDDMVRAVEIHTTGDTNMTTLDKVLFVADCTNFSDLDCVTELGEMDLDKAVLCILNYKIKLTIDRNNIIHPKGVMARNEMITVQHTK